VCIAEVSVGLDVKDRVSLKSIPFVYYCVKESYFSLSEISVVNLIEGWNLLACSLTGAPCSCQ